LQEDLELEFLTLQEFEALVVLENYHLKVFENLFHGVESWNE
jgi:hypothetical protein